MEDLDKVLKRGNVTKKNLARDNNQRMRSFMTEVPGLSAFVRRALNASIIHANFFEIDELNASPFQTHDVMLTRSRTAPRYWHFGYQRTLVGEPHGLLAPDCYRFYLVPARHPCPVVNIRKFARRLAIAHRKILKEGRLPPAERISFAKMKLQKTERAFSFQLDCAYICNDDEATDVPSEFLKFVSELETALKT
jgi:hypothetical protein